MRERKNLKRLVSVLGGLGLLAGLLAVVPLPAAHAAAVAPPTVYVTNVRDNTVTPINATTKAAGDAIPVGTGPAAVAISPDGRTAYVYNFYGETVTPIPVGSTTPGKAITVGTAFQPQSGDPAFPHIVITPDGKTAYVADKASGNVVPIDLATNTAGTPIAVAGPNGLAVSPDSKTVYVTSGDTIVPITTANNATASPIALTANSSPAAIAITPDGKTAYVANESDDTVTPITLASKAVGTPIHLETGAGAVGIAITPDGKTAYVADSGTGNVTPITLAGNTAGTPILAGNGAIVRRYHRTISTRRSCPASPPRRLQQLRCQIHSESGNASLAPSA